MERCLRFVTNFESMKLISSSNYLCYHSLRSYLASKNSSESDFLVKVEVFELKRGSTNDVEVNVNHSIARKDS